MAADKNDEFHRSIESLRTQVEAMKKTISSLRKSGKDVEIAYLKALDLPYQIKIYEATKDPKDLNKLKDMISDAQKEIQDAQSKVDEDSFKTEVEDDKPK